MYRLCTVEDEDWMKKERTKLLEAKAEMFCLPVCSETRCSGSQKSQARW